MKYVSCPRLQVPSHPAAAGSSEVRVRHSAPQPEPVAQDRDRDGHCDGHGPAPTAGATPGPRDSRRDSRPVVVHPGNMGAAGDEALNSWLHDTAGRTH